MIVEVSTNLFVGDAEGIREAKKRGMYIIHAAKEPWHRECLGYTGRAAPKDHPHYLWYADTWAMCCNLVDAPDAKYVPDELVTAIVWQMQAHLSIGKQVFIHCNKGESRAPTMALLYLLKNEKGWTVDKFKEAYPAYNPGAGMTAYLQQFIAELR